LSVSEDKIKLLNKLKQNDFSKYKGELEKIRKNLFKEHCYKKNYKNTCEPAYCVFAYNDTCDYIKEIRKINEEVE